MVLILNIDSVSVCELLFYWCRFVTSFALIIPLVLFKITIDKKHYTYI